MATVAAGTFRDRRGECNGVNARTETGQSLSEPSSEVGHAGFGKATDALAQIGPRRPSRTEIIDLAVAAIDHQPPSQLAAKEYTFGLKVENSVPVLFSHFRSRLGAAKARAVH